MIWWGLCFYQICALSAEPVVYHPLEAVLLSWKGFENTWYRLATSTSSQVFPPSAFWLAQFWTYMNLSFDWMYNRWLFFVSPYVLGVQILKHRDFVSRPRCAQILRLAGVCLETRGILVAQKSMMQTWESYTIVVSSLPKLTATDSLQTYLLAVLHDRFFDCRHAAVISEPTDCDWRSALVGKKQSLPAILKVNTPLFTCVSVFDA